MRKRNFHNHNFKEDLWWETRRNDAAKCPKEASIALNVSTMMRRAEDKNVPNKSNNFSVHSRWPSQTRLFIFTFTPKRRCEWDKNKPSELDPGRRGRRINKSERAWPRLSESHHRSCGEGGKCRDGKTKRFASFSLFFLFYCCFWRILWRWFQRLFSSSFLLALAAFFLCFIWQHFNNFLKCGVKLVITREEGEEEGRKPVDRLKSSSFVCLGMKEKSLKDFGGRSLFGNGWSSGIGLWGGIGKVMTF